MAAKIIHDHDVAFPEDGRELLLDPCAKAQTIDGSVDDTRRDEPVMTMTQSPEKGQRAPMAKRREAARARALRAPTAQRRHIGLDPGFVDENQTPGIEPGLPHPPASTPARDVGASLFKREQAFFETEAFPAQEQPHSVVRDLYAARRQLILQTMQDQMRRLCDPFDDDRPMRIENRFAVTAHLPRRDRSRGAIALRPLHHRRRRYAEPRRNRSAAFARNNRRYNAFT